MCILVFNEAFLDYIVDNRLLAKHLVTLDWHFWAKEKRQPDVG